MSLQSARAFLAERAPDIEIIDRGASTATVTEAVAALGVEPGRIAKTLAIRVREQAMLVVACGDARLDSRKTKAVLGGRPRTLGADEVLELTGHPVGGVCPFGLTTPLPIYCDLSLWKFDFIYPAAGSRTASVRIAPSALAQLVGAAWIDICR